ncbi:hypothetical protein ACSG7L_002862 [Listeria innocua]|uniref:hypothetical protein n=1 Tax=Enterococcus lactis TaxID=357441 RepID=UPI0022E38F82|nr:hypothetical protein [Enterococcus lactis]EIM5409613.1 hypothetical protein [Enterococcus faecalis]EJY7255700.1 hypothetical protein [Enterococcus faecalis]EKK0915742.1 hypothetical protein [Enterococcus faecalis]EME5446007.1 hypothetical protein [Enterococcus faecalis]
MLKKQKKLFSTLSIMFISIYIILFLSTGLDKIGTYNIWFAFSLSVFLSVGGFILSILSIIGKRKQIVAYVLLLFSLLLILFTVFIYLLPEAGIPPYIPLFY